MCDIDISGKSKITAGKLGKTEILVTLLKIKISTRFQGQCP
jgi:hypothetical protein